VSRALCPPASTDCGLKTRRWAEVIPSLKHMVEAAAIMRARVTGQAAPGTAPAASAKVAAAPAAPVGAAPVAAGCGSACAH
jgi:hypothetical protein